MSIKRGKMTEADRRSYAYGLAYVAILAAIGILIRGELWMMGIWLIYWVAGIPATKLGQWFLDTLADMEFDENEKLGAGLASIQLAIYVLWPLLVPLLGLAAFSVAMFRIALRLLE
jgi:hypothetical protein